MATAYVLCNINVDKYLTELHPAGRKPSRPWAFGSVDLPEIMGEFMGGEQVFKTPQDAHQRIKEHVNYFKDNYPTHTDLDEESDFAVYEVEIDDWEEDTYVEPYWYYEHNITNYHLYNSKLILRKHTTPNR